MAHPAAGAPAEGAEGEEEVIAGELVNEDLALDIHSFVDDVCAGALHWHCVVPTLRVAL